MEAEIWKRLPEELLFMILAMLPIRVLGKMRSVCKQWNYLLSSRDALAVLTPNWSLHSTPGFLIEIGLNGDDLEYWVIEGCGSEIFKVPLFNRIVLDTCKGIFFCHSEEDMLDLSIGIPGTGSWKHLPRPPITPRFTFTGMAFDSSTRRCTLLLGYSYIDRRAQGQNRRRIVICIYDSESNAWNAVSMMVPNHIGPCVKGIFSKGRFYWATFNPGKPIVAFNIANTRWTEIPQPEGLLTDVGRWREIAGYDGQIVLLNKKEVDWFRLWKLSESEKYEIWCEQRESDVRESDLVEHSVAVNSSGLIMVIDCQTRISIFNSNGKLIVPKMRLPGLRSSRQPVRGFGSAFESNDLRNLGCSLLLWILIITKLHL